MPRPTGFTDADNAALVAALKQLTAQQLLVLIAFVELSARLDRAQLIAKAR